MDAVEIAYREAGEVIFETAPRDTTAGLTNTLVGESVVPQGLKPASLLASSGTAEAVPHPKPTQETGPNKEGKGEPPHRFRFSQRFECKNDGTRYEEPEPRLFSFNNPYGACPRCQGFGNTIDFDLDLVIPDKGKTLSEGAVEPWTKPKHRPLFTELKRFARQAEIPLDVPWHELEPEHQRLVLEGQDRFPRRARILPVP